MNNDIHKFNENNLLFFCGSGISYASFLPSAMTVLENTCKIFLPKNIDKEKLNKIIHIQPEIFYEQLLKITNNNRNALNLWKCLHKKYNYSVPNSAHLFIVDYSYKHAVPIFTTNFDLMFEEAAQLLGIDYEVLLATDAPPQEKGNKLRICKLHGSIADNNGNLSIDSLFTTMTQISRVNQGWVEFIMNYMSDKNLCFVGYSGRDLDYFPFLSKNSHLDSSLPIVWINDFDKCKYSKLKLAHCKAFKINCYPIDYFNKIMSKQTYARIISVSIRNIRDEEVKLYNDDKFRLLYASLYRDVFLDDIEKEVFYAMLLHSIGDFSTAYTILMQIDAEFLKENSRLLYLKHLAQLNHEIGRYQTCRKLSTQLYKESRNNINYRIIAICLSSESLRMLVPVPQKLSFNYKKNIYDKLIFMFLSIRVIIYFFINLIHIKFIMKKTDEKNIDFSAIHEFIEHKIRFTSILQTIFLKVKKLTGKRLNNLLTKILIKFWNELHQDSYKEGYAAGLANSYKYLMRINNQINITDTMEIYKLTTSATGVEILLRTEAELEFENKNFKKAKSLIEKNIQHSFDSGNILNEMKAYISLAYINKFCNIKPYLTEIQISRFKFLIEKCEGNLWKNYFNQIVKDLDS